MGKKLTIYDCGFGKRNNLKIVFMRGEFQIQKHCSWLYYEFEKLFTLWIVYFRFSIAAKYIPVGNTFMIFNKYA